MVSVCHAQPLEEYESRYCNADEEHRCPVNCLIDEWNNWSECSLVCAGPGVRIKTRRILQKNVTFAALPLENPALGSVCLDSNGVTVNIGNIDSVRELETTCNAGVPCPVDCVQTSFGPFSLCSVSCGGGVQRRSRSTVVYPQHGGKSCEDDVQEKECGHLPCALECMAGDWLEWSPCSREHCLRSRTRPGAHCQEYEVTESEPCESCPSEAALWPVVLGATAGAILLAGAIAVGAYHMMSGSGGGEDELLQDFEDEDPVEAADGAPQDIDSESHEVVNVDPESSFWKN